MKSNRRQFVQTLGTSSAGMALGATLATAPEEAMAKSQDKQVLLVGDNIAVTETQYGKVRGYVLRDIHYFLGTPYGADTSGANRFMPPQKPKPWTDVYAALWWGDSPLRTWTTGMRINSLPSGIIGITATSAKIVFG